MCLFVVSGPYVADRPKKVWKVIKPDNTSAYQDFTYEPNTFYGGETLTIETNEFRQNNSVIERGFHSIEKSNCWLKGYTIFGGKDRRAIASLDEGEKLVEFIIPTGARYYKGVHGDIVSDQIVSGNLKKHNVVNHIKPLSQKFMKKTHGW